MGTKPTNPIFLQGQKTILRPLQKEDIDLFCVWINDQEVNQFLLAFLPKTKEEETKWLEHLSSLGRYPEDIVLIIEIKETRRPIGLMGLHKINWKDGVATTGAVIGEKDCWGKGFGTDAKMALLNYAFNTLGLRKICSLVIDYNGRSLQYSLHCGYKEEGRLKKQIFKNGKYRDEILLGLFKKDWQPIWKRYQKTGKVK